MNNLQKYRKYKNLTQDKLAKELNISSSLVRLIEKGYSPGSKTKIKIIKYFNVSYEQMFKD